MDAEFDLSLHGVRAPRVLRNLPPARLYEEAIRHDQGVIAANGALVALSGPKTGRSPKDKRVVRRPETARDVWWGEVNIPIGEPSYRQERQRAIDYLNRQDRVYVVDGYAGWDPRRRIKIRVLCTRAYHALFMHDMLIRPSRAELTDFGQPDYVIYNAGRFPAAGESNGSTTGIFLSLETRELVILGTEYAGEMKKGVFAMMHYLLPKQGVLSMHCSANEGPTGDVSLFFGLSGTGKTTLSADARRRLIGDDEHGWGDEGVFNIEGGCYAKCIDLSAAHEPEIFAAVRFGAVLENVVLDAATREVDYADPRITENTRAAYPIEYIPNAKVPCVGGHPRNIILLTCDASGVLPPVSRLSPEQAMYHFLSGYTARVAGTEMGVTEPQAAFSACFSAAFLVWHPTRYATMLAEKIRRHGSQVWLVNTGWTGGAFGVGSRIKLAQTRAIIDCIHAGSLAGAPTVEDPVFGLAVPVRCPGVPPRMLNPRDTWSDPAVYDAAAARLAGLFQANFSKFADAASEEIAEAGPRLGVGARG